MKMYAYFIRQELEHKILYRSRYTEQFKLHFTDKHKSKIEYLEVRKLKGIKYCHFNKFYPVQA